MDRRADLSDFFRTRRARINPADVGIETTGERRRVPGLRREELALLAGVSVDYYIRLEQGRGGVHPSDSVLAALTRAFRLDDAEHAHLRRLAHAPLASPPRRRPRPQKVRGEVQRLLDRMSAIPAFVLGRRMDVLAWNQLAARLHVDFGELPPLVGDIELHYETLSLPAADRQTLVAYTASPGSTLRHRAAHPRSARPRSVGRARRYSRREQLPGQAHVED